MASAQASTLGDALIPVINRLQDIFSQVTVDLKLTLPQVAVVGSQSSGKSSVLESLVGRDFLPRGNDIVTRRPLVLQLVKTAPGQGPVGTTGITEWGEFLHAPGKIYSNFDEIRKEIEAETDRVTGTNKNVSDKAIRLKIYSPHVLTMTLVDLPGMTKVPVGDQPTNIEARIRDMILNIISPPTVIILAVSPANTDLANSDAIQLAKIVDPEGLRTIGVLTKLDIMDRGTNASHILKGALIPLRLGYVAVVNRSQEDINRRTSVEDARKAEERFFAGKPEYRDVLTQCGITNLARRLNALLAEHIRALLPTLRRGIAESLEARMTELRGLGEPLKADSKNARGAFLLQLLCGYADRFGAVLEGRNQDLSAQRLTGGSRIRAVFNEVFQRQLKEMLPGRDVSDEAILTIIKNGSGVAGTLLVPQEPFELLVRRSILALLPPALMCKDLVYEELLHIAEQTCPNEAVRFPTLHRQLANEVLTYIRGGAEPAERMIRNLLDCEHDFINCDHPDFIGGRGAIRQVMQERSTRGARGKDSGEGNVEKLAPATSGNIAGNAGLAKGKVGAPLGKDDKLLNGGPVVQGGAAGALAMGLKGFPEGSSGMTDELLTRTRRGAGYENGIHHSATADESSLSLGAGLGRDSASGSTAPTGWFAWLKGSDRTSTPTAGAVSGAMTMANGLGNGVMGNGGITSPRTEQEEVEVEVIRRLVESYFAIVKRNLADAVPKTIMHFMVNNTKRGLQQHLIQQLYKDELLDELLHEKEDVVAKRAAAQEAVGALQAAMQALEQLPGELGAATSVHHIHKAVSQPTFSQMSHGYTPMSMSQFSFDSGLSLGAGTGLAPLERNPTLAHAARVATAATASLALSNEPPALAVSGN